MIVTVMIFLPVVIAFGVFVLDVGNAFEHRRHLQLQADAGALAAAQEFTRCFTDRDTANDLIKQKAREYAGGSHNALIGDSNAQGRVQTMLNAPSYDGPDGGLGEPCSTGYIDVKLEEEGSPPFFQVIGSHDYHGHARVQVLKVRRSEKLLPIAVEDPVPRSARAIFIDETTGAELASTDLVSSGTQGGLAIWDNSAAPIPVPITAEHIGIRIALSGRTSAGSCSDPLVACYDAAAPNAGIVHIRGWSAAGTPGDNGGIPIPRSVELVNGSCADPYFVSSVGPCTVSVEATVQFAVDPLTQGRLTADVDGTDYPMTYSPATGKWSSDAVVPVSAGAGPLGVELRWAQTAGTVGDDTCSAGGGNKCKGTFGVLQRTFGATPERSGPIALAQVSEAGVPWANSLEACLDCTRNLVVKVGIRGSLELSDPNDPPVYLRVTDGSQTQLLDCDPDESLTTEEIAHGCKRQYATNSGTACPNSPTVLWGTAEPWECVAVQPSADASNPIAKGLNCRILLRVPLNTKCDGKADICTAPNQWPTVTSGDPRVVYVVVTPFGSFAGQGGNTVPVVRLAAFYVTGWDGHGATGNPCQAEGDEPVPPGEIVGRFIKYVETPNEGGAGDETCDLQSVDVCAAVLVE